MPRAVWNGQVVAESDTFETVEGNTYFPPSAIKEEFYRKTDTTTVCPWKGKAHYYTLVVDGEENRDAAWSYPEPNAAAANIKDHVAFWKGVTIEP